MTKGEMREKLVRPRSSVFGKWSTNLTLGFLSFFCVIFSYFIYLFRLCWLFVSVRGPSLVAVSRDYPLVACTGFSLRGFSHCRAWAVGLMDFSSHVAHRLSCPETCGIFPDHG